MSRIGTNTNSNDPTMIKSRVFVGNIDTRMTREELEAIFGKYGSIAALSLHKGYGFVQYTDELFARAAVFGENNKQYYSKLLDCNVASEPKSNRKRLTQHQQAIPTQPDTWQSQSFSSTNNPYLAATAHAIAVQAQSAAAAAVAAANSANTGSMIGGTTAKRPRLQNPMDHSSGARKTSNLVSLVSGTPSHPPPISRTVVTAQDKDVKDVLICGNCKEIFENYERLISHKAVGCRLRFICRCKQMGEPRSLTCIQCGVCSQSSWELIKHHISDHGASLFVGEERYCPPGSPNSASGNNQKSDTKQSERKTTQAAKVKSPPKTSNGDTEVVEHPEEVCTDDGDRLPADDVMKDEEEDDGVELQEVRSVDEVEEVNDEPREALCDSPGGLIEDVAQDSNEAQVEPQGSIDEDESN